MLDPPPVPVSESPLRKTPLHPRTQALCRTFRWRSWNGFAVVCAYVDSAEEEYYALHNRAGLLDRCALRKLDVLGPDAAALLSRLCTRDVQKLGIGRVRSTAWTEDSGS
ncbi:MAG: hypothetical protein GWP91_18420, partial [Rhodobacterales bacterium]|nr:hypothetical protein [Rhodobacterales bacterium]